MKVRSFRFATHIGILAFCVFSLVKGINTLRYSLADRTESASSGLFESFFAVPGVADQALRDAYRNQPPARDANIAFSRAGLLTALLARAPLSSLDWLFLAEMRALSGDAPDRIVAAFAMSTIAGPNESYVMSARIPFELANWNILPRDGRNAAAADLATLAPLMSDAQRFRVHQLITDQPEDVRQTLRDMLERTWGLKPEIMERIGLGPSLRPRAER